MTRSAENRSASDHELILLWIRVQRAPSVQFGGQRTQARGTERTPPFALRTRVGRPRDRPEAGSGGTRSRGRNLAERPVQVPNDHARRFDGAALRRMVIDCWVPPPYCFPIVRRYEGNVCQLADTTSVKAVTLEWPAQSETAGADRRVRWPAGIKSPCLPTPFEGKD
jgi:hypothetical protein